MEKIFEFFRDIHLPIEAIWGLIAVTGGIARYLNSYTQGQVRFSIAIFFASAFISGFSGFMFALAGSSMDFPPTVLYVLAGLGGFFGDQTMKFLMEYFGKKFQ